MVIYMKLINRRRVAMKNGKLKLLTESAVFAALTFVLTFTLKIYTPTGYVHLGDAAVYLAASVLPSPYAFVAAGLGGALSDLLGGYVQYVLPTFIIKALLTLAFTAKAEKIICKRNLLSLIPATFITVVGYYITGAVLLALSAEGISDLLIPQTWITALSNIPENTMQAVVCAAVYVVFGHALDRLGFKKKLNNLG